MRGKTNIVNNSFDVKADDGLAVEGGLKETEEQMRHKNNENKDTDKV